MLQRRTLPLTAASAQSVSSRQRRLRAGIIGAGGRGRYLIGQFKETGTEIGAVCDIYEPNLQPGLKDASSGAKPFRDYRKLLDDKSIDDAYGLAFPWGRCCLHCFRLFSCDCSLYPQFGDCQAGIG
jgi:hypothetical protein